MNTMTDWIGFIGVTILLVAFFLNFIGAGIACFASILLDYWPFIILEGSWTLVSAFGIFKFFKAK